MVYTALFGHPADVGYSSTSWHSAGFVRSETAYFPCGAWLTTSPLPCSVMSFVLAVKFALRAATGLQCDVLFEFDWESIRIRVKVFYDLVMRFGGCCNLHEVFEVVATEGG